MASGIEYPPPKHNLPIFDVTEFEADTGDEYLTMDEAKARFCQYPTAQGNMNLQGINVALTANITGITTISDTTDSTSTGTGALTTAGGIGVAKSMNVGGNIGVGGTNAVGVYSSTPPNAATTTKSGLTLALPTCTGGVVNVNDDTVVIGTNCGSYFGTRDTSKNGAAVKLYSNSGSTGMEIITQNAGGAETTSLSVNSNTGQVNIPITTTSVSTTTGALVVRGGVGIAENLNVANTITAGVLSTTSINLIDGANTGQITQINTLTTLTAPTGGSVAIASGSALTFNNDDTYQSSAYIGREVIDDCDLHTYIYNKQNPSTKKYMLSSTFSMTQQGSSITTANGVLQNLYFYPVKLIKGQVIAGLGIYYSAGNTCTARIGLYRTDTNPNSILCYKSATYAPTTGMNYINVDTGVTTVPYTGVYYIGVATVTATTTAVMVVTGTNSYLNYGQTTMSAGILNKSSQYLTGRSTLPVDLTGLTPTIHTQQAYCVVYSTTPY